METTNSSEYEGIDLEKAITVFKKSLIWVIAIFVITNTIAYLVIRWTKPLYESNSELKLDVETNASELGLTTLGENQNLNIISGEIELLKSKLFFNKVIDNFKLDIFYFTAGKVLDDEKYKTSPFTVEYELLTSRWLDKKIDLEIIDQNNFQIDLSAEKTGMNSYKFGEIISTPDIKLVINATSFIKTNSEKYHYFRINSREALNQYLQDNLNVVPLNLNANTIKISFTDHNASKARDLVNAIDSLYLQYSQDEKNLENNQKIKWLNNELKNIETQLEGFEDYFENFTIENRTNDLDKDLANTIKYINVIDSQRFEITKKINSSRGLLSSLRSADNNIVITTDAYPRQIQESLEEFVEAITDYERIKLSYTESTFVLTRKEKELEAIKENLDNQLNSLIQSYSEQIDELEKQKNVLQKSFVELPGKSTEYNKNQRFFELYEEFYLSLMQSKAEFQIAQAGTTTQFKILAAANLATTPISPDKLIIHGIGIVSGLVFAFFFVGIRYLLYNNITTPQELERLTSAPILGYIPEEKDRMETSVLMADIKPKSAISESIRSIRTNIDFMVSKSRERVISVTSTIGGEGKTFTAVNLGAIVAMSKKKVIIVDLDMRKPRVHLSFGDANLDKGVSTLLIGKDKIEDCVVESRIENLHYINAGPTPPNPAELLLNGEFDDFLEKLKRTYDLII